MAFLGPAGTFVKAGGMIMSTIVIFLLYLGNVTAEGQPGTVAGVKFDWDPNDPPLWTIRSEDRKAFQANKTAYLQDDGGNPCVNKNHPARLYKEYREAECPAVNHLKPDGCERWDIYREDCISFCQIRTYFEWAEERPFPHSECHAPVQCSIKESDSTSCGWSISVTPKVGKALKMGVSGSWSQTYSTAQGRSWSIDLWMGQCGYFTFVPVRKVICGTLSMSVPKKMIFGWHHCVTDLKKGARHISNYCVHHMWTLKDSVNGKEIPDGTIIFVYTNCTTREPLPMYKQDPVYRVPGVALDSKTVQNIQKSWYWTTCYLSGREDSNGRKELLLRGSGFDDDKVGPNGEHLLDEIKVCIEGKVENVIFRWHRNEKPSGEHSNAAPYWAFRASVPASTTRPCIRDVLLIMGAETQTQCADLGGDPSDFESDETGTPGS